MRAGGRSEANWVDTRPGGLPETKQSGESSSETRAARVQRQAGVLDLVVTKENARKSPMRNNNRAECD